jgi:sugar lactone lactonase YvrE
MSEWTMVARDTRDQLGEGVLWSARDDALYWVDILAPALNRMSLASGAITRWAMPEPIGWVVERARGPGFIAGMKSGFAELTLDPFAVRLFADPEPDLPGNRMNDGKADAAGAIWAGTMDMAQAAAVGSLYRLAPDRSWTRVDSGYGVTNGPAFSPDGAWLYHNDTALRTVYRFARRADGTLGARETFIRFDEEQGHPDGMTVDAAGGLWIAHWGGARVSRFHADGRIDRSIALPARQITNLTFAGPELDRMFVTSAATGLPPSAYDGALFEVDCGAVGVPTGRFDG